MVSLTLVAHSDRLLGALVEMIVATTATPPPCSTAGGTEDGRMGTSLGRIRGALRAGLAAGDDGCLVLYDTGSAWLTIEFAIDELSAEERSRVVLSTGPLVEGALAAAVRAADGAPLTEVADAAASALERDKRPGDAPGDGTRLTA
ncbi:MAG TPA: PTS mannose transporter subunit IID [Candidatus Limnocylindria bacterium]